LNIKKGLTAAFLIFFGIYALQATGKIPRTGELVRRITGDSNYAENVNSSDTGSGADGETGNNNMLIEAAAEGSLPPFPSEVEIPETSVPETEDAPVVLPTTIEGGMVITNNTSYELDLGSLVSAGTSVRLAEEGPQILIIHTHGSEAYTQDKTDTYEVSDTFRTEDTEHSIIRVGDELAACLQSYGLSVIHDRNIYDYPSYTGSYAKSGAAIQKYLEEYPGISVILDVHRDAIGEGDIVYKTVAEADGKPCSQVMLLVGSGENGLEQPKWQENLKFALYLQSAVLSRYPSLSRPIALKKERYNQQLSTGFLILEVGSSGNTLNEALNAVRLFADAAAPALKGLS